MASIDKRPDGRYRARWREFPGGPQKTRQFDRKVDAQRFLDGIRGDLARGQYIDPADGRTLFRDYAEEWRTAQMHRHSTSTQCEGYLRRHAYPTFGDRPIASIRRSEIQGWVKNRSEHLAPSSVELVYRWVSTIFKSAVADRLIAASPCIKINLPKSEAGEVQPLEVDAVDALCRAVPERYRALIIFASGTGLRQGEPSKLYRGASDTGRRWKLWIPTATCGQIMKTKREPLSRMRWARDRCHLNTLERSRQGLRAHTSWSATAATSPSSPAGCSKQSVHRRASMLGLSRLP